MKGFVWLGVLLSGAAIWTVSLFVSRYFAPPQAEANMVMSVIAVAAPACFLALIADRLRLRKSLVLCVTAYCLGSAVATGLLHSLQSTTSVPASRSLEAGLVHGVTLTLFLPSEHGYAFVWANTLWLAMAGLVASIVLEALATKTGGKTGAAGVEATKPATKSSSVPRRSLRPRRRLSSRNGIEREDSQP